MVGVLGYLGDQALDFRRFGNVSWYRDSLAGEWKSVKGSACFFASSAFAGCDEDFRAAGLDEAITCKPGV